jgi:hypothetical protein
MTEFDMSKAYQTTRGYALVTASVTVVLPDLSCLISCFLLSISPCPSKSLMVSLYYEPLVLHMCSVSSTHNLKELALHRVLPAFGSHLVSGLE